MRFTRRARVRSCCTMHRLFEAGADDFCDKIIAVLAPHDTRVARIIERDGLSNEAARARIDAQPNDMFYRENAILSSKTTAISICCIGTPMLYTVNSLSDSD